MAEYLQVWRARVPAGNVEWLLEVRPAAIAKAQACARVAGCNRGSRSPSPATTGSSTGRSDPSWPGRPDIDIRVNGNVLGAVNVDVVGP